MSTAPPRHEVHGADDVVEVARVEQVGHAVLGARHEVRLDAQPQVGLLAHERAVRVEVVVREGLPEGVAPDSSACAKRYMCSETPSSAIPRSSAAAR